MKTKSDDGITTFVEGKREFHIGKEAFECFERAIILLKATSDILAKLDDTPYVLDFFEQTAVWDEVECDGYCLTEEINDLLEEVGYANER